MTRPPAHHGTAVAALSSLRGALATKQSTYPLCREMDCFAALAMTVGRRNGEINYLILSYAAAKSVSGIGIVIVSLPRFWNDTFSCLPDFIAASMSDAIGLLA